MTVKQAVTGITLDWKDIEAVPGKELTLHAKLSPKAPASQKLRWSSSNSTVATVDAEGNVAVRGYGSCVITATADDTGAVSAGCTIRVPSFYDTDIYHGGGMQDELGLFNADERTELVDRLGLVLEQCMEKYGSAVYPELVVYTCEARDGATIAQATAEAAEAKAKQLSKEYALYYGTHSNEEGPVLITINVWQKEGRASVNIRYIGEAMGKLLGEEGQAAAKAALLSGFQDGSYVEGIVNYVQYIVNAAMTVWQ